jgi:hypothetical protein
MGGSRAGLPQATNLVAAEHACGDRHCTARDRITHCRELRKLWLNGCASTVTDVVLVALAEGGRNLHSLKCDKWAIQSEATVDAAKSLLRRVETCPIVTCSAIPPVVLARVVFNLLRVEELKLWDLSSTATAAPGRGVPVSTMTRTSLRLDYQQSYERAMIADDFVLAVAGVAPELSDVVLESELFVTAATLLTLAQLCPEFSLIVCPCRDLSEDALLALINSWPLVAIVRIGHNMAVTDTVLLAMAQLCPQLECVDLSFNTRVTAAALLTAVRLRPGCNFVPPDSFDATTREVMEDAVQVARAAETSSKQPSPPLFLG